MDQACGSTAAVVASNFLLVPGVMLCIFRPETALLLIDHLRSTNVKLPELVKTILGFWCMLLAGVKGLFISNPVSAFRMILYLQVVCR